MQDQNGIWLRAVRKIILSFFLTCGFATAASAIPADTAAAKVEGTVFLLDASGNRSFVAGAKVKLNGPVTFEVETDQDGKYVVAVESGYFQ